MCGLSGFTGENPNHLRLRILGEENESRGIHSCGIAVGNEIKKGINKESRFSDMARTYKIPTKKNHSYLVHTRHATYGNHTEENAHPFKYEISKTKSLVFMHNGTLIDLKELQEDFGETDYKYTVDSDLFGYLLFI